MTSTRQAIAVHGASGTQGAAIAARLVAAGSRVRADTRGSTTVAGAENVAADLSDLASLTTAYEGVDAVVVSLPLVFDQARARQHADNVLLALRKTSVSRAVLLTSGPLAVDWTGDSFVDARTHLARELPAPVAESHIIWVSGIYMQDLTASWSIWRLRDGLVAYPLPSEAPVPWLDIHDVADAVADALAAGKASEQTLIGPETLTGDVIASHLSRHFGPLRWKQVAPYEYAAMLRPYLGAEAATGIASMYAAEPYVRTLLMTSGRTTFADWLTREW